MRLPEPEHADYLGLMLGHHAWATLSLIDRCLELSADELQLSARCSARTGSACRT